MGICIKTKGGEITFGVDTWEHRKSKVLYLQKGNKAWPLAYFRSDERAAEFQEVMDLLCEAAGIKSPLSGPVGVNVARLLGIELPPMEGGKQLFSRR